MIIENNEKLITFNKTIDDYGWLSNMAKGLVEYQGIKYQRRENLFQALRFNDISIQSKIANESNPIQCKKIAKLYLDEYGTVEMLSKKDIWNMILTNYLFYNQHKDKKDQLLKLKDFIIIEDVTKRGNGNDLFWGMKRLDTNFWVGGNMLGNIISFLISNINHDLSEIMNKLKDCDFRILNIQYK